VQYRPNPQPLPYKGRGVRFKASLVKGERFGERSNCIAFKREPLYLILSNDLEYGDTSPLKLQFEEVSKLLTSYVNSILNSDS
jgi:hypothetical protein